MSPAAAPRVLVAEDDPAILSLIRSFERISDDDRRVSRPSASEDRRRRAIFGATDARRTARTPV
jgi:hypothetical protein